MPAFTIESDTTDVFPLGDAENRLFVPEDVNSSKATGKRLLTASGRWDPKSPFSTSLA